MTQQAFADIDPDFPAPLRPFSQSELVKISTADPATISRAIADGYIDPAADWRVQLGQLYKHLSERAAGRRGDGPLDLVQERARLAAAQADKTAFELRRLRGEYVPGILIRQFWESASAVVRQNLLSLAHRFKSLRPHIAAVDIHELDLLIRESMTAISKSSLPEKFLKMSKDWENEGVDPDGMAKSAKRRTRATTPKKSRRNRKARARKRHAPAEQRMESVHTAS